MGSQNLQDYAVGRSPSTHDSSNPGDSARTRGELPLNSRHAEAAEPSEEKLEQGQRKYLQGWRLHAVTVSICFSLFLSALDLTIVSTSLVSIADNLRSFDQSAWIVTAYLLTYTSFLIIWAKLSDIFGRKLFLCLAIAIFVVFSAACAASQKSIEIIIFRAFQGIGGAGIYSVASVMIPELVPRPKYPLYNGLVAATSMISFLLGPLFGGAINDGTSWRWIFIINIIFGVITLALIFISMPNTFPLIDPVTVPPKSSLAQSIRAIDFLGFFLLLSASILFICAIEEAGTAFEWRSAFVITLVIVAGLCMIALLVREWRLFKAPTQCQPVLPWQLINRRLIICGFLTAIMSGSTMTVLIIELPQRFQTVNQKSALGAAIRTLPFSVACGAAAGLSGPLVKHSKIPPVVILLVGALLQVLGTALLYAIAPDLTVAAQVYGFEILAGVGTGLSLTTLLVLMPYVVEPKDIAVAFGGVAQSRILGGAIGIAGATNALNNYVSERLAGLLQSTQIRDILENSEAITHLDQQTQMLVRQVFSEGYNKQILVVLAMSCVGVVTTTLMFERHLRRVA